MSRRFHLPCFVALTLALAFSGGATPAHAATAAPGAKGQARSSSKWLRAGEARQAEGDHAGAGKAYTMALDALSPQKQRANEGARAAMLAAEAYWQAFVADDDLGHLDAGYEILARWLELAGPGSRATLLPMVERMAARNRAVHDPLEKGATALEAGDLEKAATHDREALEALAVQRREWSVGARVTLRIAGAHVDAYDQRVAADAGAIEASRPLLQTATELLEDWKQRRDDDDESGLAPRIDEMLAEIQRRMDEGDQALSDAALAAQEREAREQAEAERQAREAEAERRRQEEEASITSAKRRRVVSIVLLSSGAVATAAGAGLLGEGIAFSGASQRAGEAEEAEAQTLSDMFGADYPREDFDRALDEYYADARRRNLAFIASGSVLVAGGITAGVIGLVRLRKDRRATRGGAVEQARLVPSLSRTQLGLLLSARF